MTGVGVIGCGQRMRNLCQQLIELGEIKIAAYYEPQDEQAERFVAACILQKTTPERMNSWEELIKREELSWIMIGSPNVFHARQAVAAIGENKQLFLEKPLAVTRDECLQLLRVCAQTKAVLTTGFVLRYSPLYQRMRQLLDRHPFGPVVSIQASEHISFSHGSYMMRNWRRKRAMAGSFILEKCVHDLDLLQWMAGSPIQKVTASGGRSIYLPERYSLYPAEELTGWEEKGNLERDHPFCDEEDLVEDHGVIQTEFASGAVGQLHVIAGSALPERRMALHCLRGTLIGELTSAQLIYRTVDMETPETETFQVERLHGGGDAYLVKDIHGQMLGKASSPVDIQEAFRATLAGIAAGESLLSGNAADLSQDLDLIGTLFPGE